MSRDIKFRAWDKASKMFAYAELKPAGYEVSTPANDADWQQATGLRDKHGVEIYEGDIIQVANERTYQVKYGHFIAYYKPQEAEHHFGWYMEGGEFKNQFILNEHVEVIGNIYENPELLESGS